MTFPLPARRLVLSLLTGLALIAAANSVLAVDVFDLAPDRPDLIRTARNPAAIAKIPAGYAFANPGFFTIANTASGGPPLSTYANDAKTVVGADPDIARLIADALGLELKTVVVAWADWPLGLTSGKYDAVISNVGVTEERKEKFDFSTYRQGLHGFFTLKDRGIERIAEPKDIAGLRIIVGAGTNQERILLDWDRLNREAGLAPVELQYFDDEATRLIALRSGRADVIVQPHAQLVYIAARDGDIRRVGTLSAGWPERSDVAVTTRRGSGLAEAVTEALNGAIADGSYARVLERWQLTEEALPESQTNPPGLPKY
ncbi:ABC transporter substrate-binding protein [Paenirhodobacter sp.]|uniref:ABC transporter substrate-binding protein n=1 Tax=Paenirhodobacter sp. TaxID=1965326 RepID=UPI003B3F7F01